MPDHFHAVVILLDPLPCCPTRFLGRRVARSNSWPAPERPVGSRAHAVRPYEFGAGAVPDPPVGSRAHVVVPEFGPGALPDPLAGSRAQAVRPYLGRIVAGFKSSCTRRYLASIPGASGPLWQRGYYEHVVRGAAELDRIRTYIADNPRRWKPPCPRRSINRSYPVHLQAPAAHSNECPRHKPQAHRLAPLSHGIRVLAKSA